MKRVFIFISTILFSCYLVTMIVQQNQQISFSSYNAVDVIGNPTKTNSEIIIGIITFTRPIIFSIVV